MGRYVNGNRIKRVKGRVTCKPRVTTDVVAVDVTVHFSNHGMTIQHVGNLLEDRGKGLAVSTPRGIELQ